MRFDGEPIGRLPAHRRVAAGIALVPEGRRIFPSLTVEENLRIGGHARRRGPWGLDEVYELFPALDALSGRWGGTLSGGEQQMCAIGRALMGNPRLILLDELSLGLAPKIIKAIYETIGGDLRSEGTTVVLVEQDIGQALAAADRAYCLLEGRVSLQGPTAELTREQVVEAYFGVRLMVWVNQIVQGILLGGLYALFATGLSLVFGVMRLVNLAHGDLIVLASFLSLVIVDNLGWNPLHDARPRHPADGRRSASRCSTSCSTTRSTAGWLRSSPRSGSR